MISCAQYDYIEIACLYRVPVVLLLLTGEEVTGIAVDTERNENREECLRLRVGEEERRVVLDQLRSMEALEPNPYFRKVVFDRS